MEKEIKETIILSMKDFIDDSAYFIERHPELAGFEAEIREIYHRQLQIEKLEHLRKVLNQTIDELELSLLEN